MTRLTLRAATPEDVPQLTALIRAAYAIYDGRGIDLPPVSEGLDAVVAETPVIVAMTGPEISGAIVLRDGPDALQIENLAVHPDATGRGLGKRLLEEAETIARAKGFNLLRLATHRNLTENISLYRHLGWTVTEATGLKILMQKPLPQV
ncbi:GNAT family N-acetyltransferase [Nioella aestuarii]|uniref:GNAT family N-acetyltransferase n=1 Tax=Nioella aestuarii TaxID=1662864 RepID=UPI003D7F75A5